MMRKLVLLCALLWLVPQAGSVWAFDAPGSSIPFEGKSVDSDSIELLIAQLTAVNSGLTPKRAEAAGARDSDPSDELKAARLRLTESVSGAIAALEVQMAEARATMEREVREATAAFERDLRLASENAERRVAEAEAARAAERERAESESIEREGRIDDLIRENQALRSRDRERGAWMNRMERPGPVAAIEEPGEDEVPEAHPAKMMTGAIEESPAGEVRSAGAVPAPTIEQYIRTLRAGLTLTPRPEAPAPLLRSGRPMTEREIRVEIARLRAEIARLKREEAAEMKAKVIDKTIPPPRC